MDEGPQVTTAPEVRIILVRHGQTDWSDERYMGREDVSLNDTGRAQATRLVDLLAREQIDAIWSSPLARARQTSGPLAAQRGVGVTIVDDLVEMDYGHMQGARKADRRIHIKEDHVVDPIPGGESLTDVARRAGQVCTRLSQELVPGVTLVMIGHYRVSQFVLGAMSGRSFEEVIEEPGYRPGNGTAYAVDCVLRPDQRLTATSARYVANADAATTPSAPGT